MDKLNLIAEVRKRPYLWQPQRNKCRHQTIDLWNEVARSLGADAKLCKNTWGQLRARHRTEERNVQQRIQRLISNGQYNPKNNHSSKWVYFDHMKFLSAPQYGEKTISSNNENLDEEFEIEIVIEDSDHSALSEGENQKESMHKTETKQASVKNVSLLCNKGPRKRESVPRPNLSNNSAIENVIIPQYNQITSSNENSNSHVLMTPVTTTANKDEQKNISRYTKNNNSSEVQVGFIGISNMVIKQEPGSSSDGYAGDRQKSCTLQGGQISTGNSSTSPFSTRSRIMDKNMIVEQNLFQAKNAPLARNSMEVIQKIPTISNTTENKNKVSSNDNDSCTKCVQFHKTAEVVHIKEEPVDYEESNENVKSYPVSNKSDKNNQKESSAKEFAPKRVRVVDTNSMLNQSPIDREKPQSSNFSRNTESYKSVPNVKESKISSHTTVDIGDMDCNFLVSFLTHMRSMSHLQNLEFRAKMSNLMLNISSSREMSEKVTGNTLENQGQSALSRAVVDIGDPDGNFLVSFLPHLKSMSRFQNLQFRAKMSQLMFSIFSTSVFAGAVSDSTTI